MLNAVIRFSLRYRMLVVVLSLTLLVYGGYLATTLPIDVFPDLDRPRVVIITECPGLATEEVETLVTQPIEISLLGANGVQAVRSQTTAGLNVIYIEFDWTTDVRTARQIVQERLATLAGVLPEGIRPQMTPTASIMGQIVIAGMYRQQGPSGGELVSDRKDGPDGGTGSRATAGTPDIRVWRPVDRREPSSWEARAGRPCRVEAAGGKPGRADAAWIVKQSSASAAGLTRLAFRRRNSSRWRCARRPIGSSGRGC